MIFFGWYDFIWSIVMIMTYKVRGVERCGKTENHFIRIYSGENCKWENNLWKLPLRRAHIKWKWNSFAFLMLITLRVFHFDAWLYRWKRGKWMRASVCLLLFMLILYDACMMCMHSHLIQKAINTAVVKRIETNQRFDGGWMDGCTLEVSTHLKSIKYNQ